MKKNILFLIEADLTSGASKCGFELIKKLAQDSDYTPIVVTQHKYDFNDACTEIGVENYHFHFARICSLGMGWLGWLIAFFMRPFLNLFAFIRLKRKIDLKNISIIHSNGSSIDFGAYLYKKTGITHLWFVRDFFLFGGNWRPLVRNISQYMENNASKIITVSEALRKYLLSHGCNPNKVKTIYDGIDYPICETKTHDDCTNKDILRIACVGQITKDKGQETLIDAIALIPRDLHKHFLFDFYGDFIGNNKKVIQGKIERYKISDIINFKGYSKKIHNELQMHDIGVQPSHSEGFSRVTAEYMFAGLCIIAANEGAIPELIENQENGFLYEDYNAKKLSDILMYCYNNQCKIKNLAKKAHDKAVNNFTLEHNHKNIANLYNEFC